MNGSLRVGLVSLLSGACLGAGFIARDVDLVVLGELDHVSTAVLISDGVIVEVKPGGRVPKRIRAPVIEVQRITAGLVDAHGHPRGLGQRRAEVDLVGLPTYASVLEALAALDGDGWILGRGWDQNDWPDTPVSGWPTATDLDVLFPERPVRLRRVDGHAVWVNSAALRSVGPLPVAVEGGRVLRDVEGGPAGVLIDNAMGLVPTPEPTDADLREWLKVAFRELLDEGLTGVHAMGADDRTVRAYEALDAADDVPLRVWLFVDPDSDAAEQLLVDGPRMGRRVSVVGIKAYADGALGSRGALLREDYSDEPGHRGLAIQSTAELSQLAVGCLRTRVQLAVHAIGDGGVTAALDAFAYARTEVPEAADIRFRIEHAQVVDPRDIPRFLTLGVVASMQPVHATSDMPWAEDRLGADRVQWSYAWRSMLDAGIPLAFGSDFPVEEVDPVAWFRAATQRVDGSGSPVGGWYIDQALTEAESLRAFTIGAAFAVHAEDRWGGIEVGRVADLTLWEMVEGTWHPMGVVVDGVLRRTPRANKGG